MSTPRTVTVNLAEVLYERPKARPPVRSFAPPCTWGRMAVPGGCHHLKPGNDLVRRRWVTPFQRVSLQDALNRLGHIQPGAPQRGILRHNPMRETPADEVGRLMPGQIIQH